MRKRAALLMKLFAMMFIILSIENFRKKTIQNVVSMIGDDTSMNDMRGVLFKGGRRRS